MVAAGHLQRIELERAESLHHRQDGCWVGRQRARRGEQVASDEEPARRGAVHVGHIGHGPMVRNPLPPVLRYSRGLPDIS